MTAPTRCAWKLFDEVLCASCASHAPTMPMTEDGARKLADAETVYCDRCDALIFPAARCCPSCREWIEDPRDWSIDYCRKCAESAESVHRSDMQQAARFGTAGGHP